MDDQKNGAEFVGMTASIVSAYVANNAVQIDQLDQIISDVHSALLRASRPAEEPSEISLIPAVPVKRSVTPDYIICLEDGKRFKSLKRHLMSSYNMTPDEYRARWCLPADYPMVSTNYAATRSELAKSLGLGRRPGTLATSPSSAAGSDEVNALANRNPDLAVRDVQSDDDYEDGGVDIDVTQDFSRSDADFDADQGFDEYAGT